MNYFTNHHMANVLHIMRCDIWVRDAADLVELSW